MIRTAVYARYSDANQNAASIEQQLRLLHARAESEGWTIVAEFVDRAITGSTKFRPGYQSLMAAAFAGQFDIVLTESVDRLSRDMEDIPVFTNGCAIVESPLSRCSKVTLTR